MATKPAVVRLLQLVLERFGIEPPAQPRKLAERLGWSGYDGPKKADRLIKGQSDPRASTLIPILVEAGLLTREAELAWTGLGEAAEAAAQAETLARRLSRESRPRGARGTGRSQR